MRRIGPDGQPARAEALRVAEPARPGASMNHHLQLAARPERHALSRVRPPEHRGRLALHQLRGKVAEAGGSGTGCGDLGATSRLDGRERRTQPVRTPDQRKPAPAPRPNRAGTRPPATNPGVPWKQRYLSRHTNPGLGAHRLHFHRLHLRDVGSAIGAEPGGQSAETRRFLKQVSLISPRGRLAPELPSRFRAPGIDRALMLRVV